MGMEDGADFRWMGAQCYLVAQARLRLLMLRFDGVGGCAARLWCCCGGGDGMTEVVLKDEASMEKTTELATRLGQLGQTRIINGAAHAQRQVWE